MISTGGDQVGIDDGDIFDTFVFFTTKKKKKKNKI
jgi:hypothetical protein